MTNLAVQIMVTPINLLIVWEDEEEKTGHREASLLKISWFVILSHFAYPIELISHGNS